MFADTRYRPSPLPGPRVGSSRRHSLQRFKGAVWTVTTLPHKGRQGGWTCLTYESQRRQVLSATATFCFFFVFVFESPIIMGQDDRKGEGGVLSVAADAPVREGKETLILFVCIQRRWGDKGEYSSRRINNCYSAPRGSLYRKHRHCPKSLLAVLILIYF